MYHGPAGLQPSIQTASLLYLLLFLPLYEEQVASCTTLLMHPATYFLNKLKTYAYSPASRKLFFFFFFFAFCILGPQLNREEKPLLNSKATMLLLALNGKSTVAVDLIPHGNLSSEA